MPPKGLTLKDVVLLGRTYHEYTRFFDLGPRDLRDRRVLDVGAGVASFAGEAAAHGFDVVATDPIYGSATADIERKCAGDLDEVVRQLPGVLHNYVWGTFYRDVDDLRRWREVAYRRFLEHYARTPERYVPAALPELPFAPARFDLTLVSHLLFLYEDRLDYDFHRRSLLELARVTAGEIRLYPLTRMDAQVSPMASELEADPACAGLSFERRTVPFEFFQGATEMLVVRHR